jgi:hypothetical protein
MVLVFAADAFEARPFVTDDTGTQVEGNLWRAFAGLSLTGFGSRCGWWEKPVFAPILPATALRRLPPPDASPCWASFSRPT